MAVIAMLWNIQKREKVEFAKTTTKSNKRQITISPEQAVAEINKKQKESTENSCIVIAFVGFDLGI